MINHIHTFSESPSTMDELKALAREGAPLGTVVVAERQTEGRGRQGRSWFSDEDSLTFSILYAANPSRLSSWDDMARWVKAVAESVIRGISKVVRVDVRLEWPNDLIVDDEKIGGILVETATQGDTLHSVVVGIGLNVNNERFPMDLQHSASSLYLKRQTKIDKTVLFDHLIKELRELS
jgi:BirA family biotin operon repressor/biotin-[acetyl-CoA-carboxylase] ligase